MRAVIEKFPPLFTVDAQGIKRHWKLSLLKEKVGFAIKTEYGIVGGNPLFAEERLREATLEKAKARCASKMKEKIDAQYTEDPSGIPNPSLAPLPMLAHNFDKQIEKVSFPVFVQPKLDGFRCIAVKKEGVVSCWSRKGHRFETTAQIEHELGNLLREGDMLDGELYNHSVSFDKLSSDIRNVSKNQSRAKYYLYDFVSLEEQKTRLARLSMRFNQELSSDLKKVSENLRIVPTRLAKTPELVRLFAARYVEEGYEGGMVRQTEGLYKVKGRSYDLLKVKNFQDKEFVIVGAKDGVGREQGAVIWECETEEGGFFSCRPTGGIETRQKMFRESYKYIGCLLTVKYFGLGEQGVPRFPVGVRIRMKI